MPQLLEQTQQRDMTCRELTLRSDSINEQDRSFEAVVATETPAIVFDMRSFELIDEILIAKGGQFPNQVPLLDDHQRSSGINSVMGSANNFRLQGSQWVGRGVIGVSADGNIHREQTWLDVRNGHVNAVSIGYQVINFVDIPAGQSQEVNGKIYKAGERTLRITSQWRVHELSLTPIPADKEALIRKQQGTPPAKTRRFFR